MIDEILGDLRECIELVADAKQQSTSQGELDVHLMRDGAHRVVASLVAAAEAIEGPARAARGAGAPPASPPTPPRIDVFSREWADA